MKYLYLALAVIFEVLGSSFMSKSEGFSKVIPTLFTFLFFGVCFFFFSQALKEIPLGIAYAIWAGLGLVLTALVSVLIFKQNIDLAGFIGIGLILVGVVILNVFSKSGGH